MGQTCPYSSYRIVAAWSSILVFAMYTKLSYQIVTVGSHGLDFNDTGIISMIRTFVDVKSSIYFLEGFDNDIMSTLLLYVSAGECRTSLKSSDEVLLKIFVFGKLFEKIREGATYPLNYLSSIS